jgi:hydrogenase maturation protease
MSDVLVIGYGNELRGDDAVGWLAAERVAAWGLPGVEVLSLRQLTPELCERLATARQVIFIDASAEGDEAARVRSLAPSQGDAALGHISDPRWLLGLTEALHGHRPEAWLMTVPARSLELGAPLSATARRGLETALRAVRELLDGSDPA